MKNIRLELTITFKDGTIIPKGSKFRLNDRTGYYELIVRREIKASLHKTTVYDENLIQFITNLDDE